MISCSISVPAVRCFVGAQSCRLVSINALLLELSLCSVSRSTALLLFLFFLEDSKPNLEVISSFSSWNHFHLVTNSNYFSTFHLSKDSHFVFGRLNSLFLSFFPKSCLKDFLCVFSLAFSGIPLHKHIQFAQFKFTKMLRFVVLVFLCFSILEPILNAETTTCSGTVRMSYRNDKISITDFGGVGDGRTLNTNAFREAIYRIYHLRRRGGTLLYIPPGVYLTESFNLTSHMTLYLARGAVIKATQETRNWPLIAPLPSYGRGRELPGERYISFIHGDGVHDVIITGENGTIDGQGEVWWNMWRRRTLQFTRPNLIEFMNSRNIIISDVIIQNSPFWNIHPVYCSNVVVRYVTILAPADSPNTDGIDPDSSSHVCIEDSYISTGDDLVAVKSGWDQYGISYGRPSSDITIRRIRGSTPFSGIAVGSETSGGVENVLAEHINLTNVGVGIHVKTNIGRGGTIRNITVSDVFIQNARKGIKIAGDVGGHPDEKFDPNALPVVKDITIKNVRGVKVLQAGLIHGLRGSPFTGICLSNINLNGATTTRSRDPSWKCSDVTGGSYQVSPGPCSLLVSSVQNSSCSSHF